MDYLRFFSLSKCPSPRTIHKSFLALCIFSQFTVWQIDDELSRLVCPAPHYLGHIYVTTSSECISRKTAIFGPNSTCLESGPSFPSMQHLPIRVYWVRFTITHIRLFYINVLFCIFVHKKYANIAVRKQCWKLFTLFANLNWSNCVQEALLPIHIYLVDLDKYLTGEIDDVCYIH